MTNPSKNRGTAAETAVARFLETHGWPYAERRSLAGALDKGDITGTPGVCWEVKAGYPYKWSEWLDETLVETVNSKAEHGVLVSKPKGVGVTRVDRWFAVMEADRFDRLAGQSDLNVTVLAPQPYSMLSVRNALAVRSEAYPVLDLRRMGLREHPERNYRVMHLDTITWLLRAAGFGNPLTVESEKNE